MLAFAAALAGMALTGLTAWSIGRRAFGAVLPAPLQLACGTALLSVVIFLMLTAHIAKPAAFVALSVLAAGQASACAGLKPRSSAALLAALPFILLYLTNALAPEIQPDSLHYHLNLPIAARETGAFPKGISFYEVMPQGLETIFTMAYSIGRDPAAKFFHLLLLAATVPLMLFTARQLGMEPRNAPWAALFYSVTPVVGAAATCTYNDAALAFFTLAAFSLTLEARQQQNPKLAAAAGLCAGFCYAIKFTGGFLAASMFVMIALTRRSNLAWRFLAAAAAVAGPWILRSYLLTGNPVAPLANRLFPNPYFHIETEQKLGEFLRDYGGLSWAEVPRELTLSGEVLQGFLGPLWLLAPLAILTLRRPSRRIAWLGIAAALAPWFLNLGTRFTIPALPLLALSLFDVLPVPAAPFVALAHAILSWPAITPLYCLPDAWRIREIPWRAALHIEKPDEYRKRASLEWNLAAMVQHYTTPADRILDLADAPLAASRRQMVNNWQTALGDRLLHSIRLGWVTEPGTLFEWKSISSGQPIDSIRIALAESTPSPWSVHEIRLDGIRIGPAWSLAALNASEAPLAADGLLTTYWSTWDATPSGTSIELVPPSPVQPTAIRILTGQPAHIAIEVHAAGAWTPLKVQGPAKYPALNLRLDAMAAVKQAGIQFVLARTGTDILGNIGASMSETPSNWGLVPVGIYEQFRLYRLQ